MDKSTRIRVVKLLISDSEIVRRWAELFDLLGLHESEKITLEHQFKRRGITAYDLFNNILSSWISLVGKEGTVDNLYTVCLELKFQCIAEKLRSGFSSIERSKLDKIFFNTEKVSWNFIGRRQELKTLQKLFNKSALVKVIGLGGIGKSELCKKFAEKHSGKGHCIWLNGDTEDTLNNSVNQLAETLRISITDAKLAFPESMLSVITEIDSLINEENSTANRLPSLVIIDNIDVTNTACETLIKKLYQLSYRILVTSRNISVLNFAGHVLNLENMGTENAQELVQMSFPSESKINIENLCKLLENFPLALQQAIGFIKYQKASSSLGQSYSIANYLSSYEMNKSILLNTPLNQIEYQYHKTTMMTWNVSIDQIWNTENIGRLAMDLLNLISYLKPDNIPVNFLMQLVSEDNDLNRNDHNEAILLLKEYSLLKVDNNLISIHRLVQEVTRAKQADIEFDIVGRLMLECKDTIKDSLGEELPQIESIWNYCCRYEELVKQFYDVPNKIFLRKSECSTSSLGQIKNFLDTSFTLLRKILGESHLETISVGQHLAFQLHMLNENDESLEKYIFVYEQTKLLFGQEHAKTIEAVCDVSRALSRLNRYEAAENIMKDIPEMVSKVFGDKHRLMIDVKGTIADALYRQKKYSLAMNMYESVLDWNKRKYGQGHWITLRSEERITDCLKMQGRVIDNYELPWIVEMSLQIMKEEDYPDMDLPTLAHKVEYLRDLFNFDAN